MNDLFQIATISRFIPNDCDPSNGGIEDLLVFPTYEFSIEFDNGSYRILARFDGIDVFLPISLDQLVKAITDSLGIGFKWEWGIQFL